MKRYLVPIVFFLTSFGAFATVPVFQSATATSTTTIDIEYDINVDFNTTSGNFIAGLSALGLDLTGATASISGTTVTVTLTVALPTNYSAVNLSIGAGTIKDDLTADTNAGLVGTGVITDGISPAFASAQTTSSTSIAVTFSENISTTDFNDFTSGDFTVTGAVVDGGDATIVNLTVDPIATDLVSTDLDIAVGAVNDGANDNAEQLNQSVSDGAGPEFVSATATSLTNIDIVFSEDISSINAFGDFTGADFTANAAAIDGGDATIVNLSVNTLSGTDFVTSDLDIAAGAVSDGTNANLETLNRSVSDGIAPTFASAQTTSSTSIAVTFSENISTTDFNDFTSGDFTVTGAVVDGGDATIVNLTVDPIATDLVSTDLDIAVGAVNDGANDNAEQLNRSVSDGAGPEFASAQTISSTSIAVTFSEDISTTDFNDFTSGDFTVTGAVVDGGDATIVNLTVDPIATDLVSTDLDIAVGAVNDGANDNAEQLNQSVSDGAGPEFVSATATSLTNIDIVFSEDISSINAFGDFTGADFTANAAAIDGGDATIVNLSVNTLSGTDFVTSDLDIAAGAVNDGTNANLETLNRSVSDGIAPTFASAQTTSSTSIAVTFSENISTTDFNDFTSGDFTVTGAVVDGGDATIVNLTVDPIATDLVSTDLDIAVGAVNDGANDNAEQLNQSVSDGAGPEFVSATATSLTNIDIVFSEDISSINAFGDFTGADFTANAAAIDGGDATIVNLSVNTLSGTDFVTSDLDIAAGAVSDGTNANLETLNRSVSDGIAPTFASAQTTSSTSIAVTFSENISTTDFNDFTSGDFTVTGAVVDGGDATIVNLTVDPIATDLVSTDLDIAVGAVNDGANDNAEQLNQSVSDGAGPEFVSATATSLTNIDIVFSEDISSINAFGDFTGADFTANAAAIDGGDATIVNLSVNTLSGTDFVTSDLDIAAGAVSDGTNANLETLNRSVSDGIAPTFASAQTTSSTSIAVTFSENISTTDFNDFTSGDFTVTGAVVDGGDATIVNLTVDPIATDLVSTDLDIAVGAVNDGANDNAEQLNRSVSDGAGPEFASAQTTSSTSIAVTFSEDISTTDFNDFTSGDFTVTGAVVDGGDATIVNLTVDPIATDLVSTDLDIAVGAVNDGANDNAEQLNQSVSDGAGPEFVSATATSLTNIDIVFSEDISSINAFGDFTGADFTANAAAIDGGDATIVNLSVNTLSGTDFVTSDLDIAAGAVSDGTNANLETLNRSVSDGIAPTFASAQTTSSTSIAVTFSENISTTDFNDFTSGDFTVTGAVVDGGDATIVNLTVDPIATDLVSTDLDIAVGAVNDGANDNAEQLNQSVSDGAGPVIESAATNDDDGDGQIDQIVVTFSEVIDGSTLDNVVSSGATSEFSVGGGYDILSIDTDAGSLANDNVVIIVLDESGSSDTDETPTLTFTDAISTVDDVATSPNASLSFSGSTIDQAAPAIVSQTLDANNAYLEITFSEGLYTSTGTALTSGVGEFALDFNQNTGDATAGVILVYSQADNTTATAAGDDVIRFQLEITGIPDGDETIQVNAVTSSVFDNASPRNAMADGNPLGSENLFPVSAADIPTFVSALPAPDNSYIIVEFSIPVDDNSSTSNTGNLEIRTSGGDDFNPELRTGSFLQNGGGATNATANNQSMTAADGSAQATGTTWRYTPNIPGGTPTGDETFTIFPKNGAEVWGSSTGLAMLSDDEITVTLADEFQNDFDNATATAYDVDGDGNIDEVEIVMPDGIDDSTLDEGDFTFNGVAADAMSFNTGVANDNTFRLTFSGYTGTAVVGTLDFSDGNLRDDAAFSVYDDGSSPQGNVFIATTGSIIPADGAGPVVQSAITADNDLDGQIDRITLTFSETFNNVSIDETDFSVGDGFGTPASVSFASPPEVILTLTESGTPDTDLRPDVDVLVAGILQDQSAANAPNPIQTFTSTADGAAPYITVNSGSGNATPDFSGTIDDPTASVIISADGQTRSTAPAIQNNGDGTWSYTSALDVSPITIGSQGLTDYEVTIIGIDQFGNNRTDVTSNEYTLTGGASITAATPATLCESDGFASLGQIVIDESGNGDFSAGTDVTLLLTLPAGFEFNTSGTADADFTASALNDISVISSVFIGTASLQITMTVTGTSGDDIVRIDDLEVRVTTGGSSGNLVRTGGNLSLLTSDVNYATLTSNTAPDDFTELEEGGTGITSFTTRFLPRVTINYNMGPLFTDGEDFVFSGGATGTMVSGTDIGTQLDVYITSGTIGNGETFTGQTSLVVGTINSVPVGVSSELLDFTLDANPTATARWYNSSGGLINSLPSNTNTALSATMPGLYTYEITDANVNCESNPLSFNVHIFDDVHPDNFNESTFVNRSFSVNAARDTIYMSRPAGHTVNITGNGISVVGGTSDPLLAIFDPSVAGDDGAGGPQSHTITYTITNTTTMESASITRSFEVVPETEFFDPGLADAYCIDDFPLTDGADNLFIIEEADFWVNDNTNTFQIVFDNGLSTNVISGDENSSFMFFQNDALNRFFGTYGDYQIPIDVTTWSSLDFGGFGNATDYVPNPGEGSVFFIERFRFDNGLGTSTSEFDYMEVYGEPRVSISNIASQYCEDADPVTIARNARYIQNFTADDPEDPFTRWIPTYGIENNESISNGYELWKETTTPGVYALYEDFTGNNLTGTGPSVAVNVFDPEDPDQDLDVDEDETGNYRIVYISEDNLTPVSCTGSATFDFTIDALPNKLELNDDTRTDGGSVDFVNTDEYLLEYCIFDAYHSGFALDGTIVTLNYINLTGGSFTVGESLFSFSTFAGLPGSSALGRVLTDDGSTITMSTFSGEFLAGTHLRNSAGIYAEISSVSYSAADVTWYDEGLDVIPAYENVPVLGADAAGLNLDALRRFGAAETREFYFSTTNAQGCESELRKVTVTVHGKADAVELTLPVAFDEDLVRTGSAETSFTYNLDYCTNTPGGVVTPDDLTLPALSGNDIYRVLRYFDDNTGSGFAYLGFNDYSTNTIPISSDQPAAGQAYRYNVFLVDNINPDAATSSFGGCLSNLTSVFINASDVPVAPSIATDFTTLSGLDLHVCEGGDFSSFVNSASGIDEYVWYAANGTDEILRVSNGSNFTSANLITNATLAQYDNNDPGVYTFQVSRIQSSDPSRGFLGCESAQTTVTIEVHSLEGAPDITVSSGSFADTDGDAGDDSYHYIICLSELDQTEVLDASSAFGDPKDFNWYASDAGASVGALIYSDPDPNTTDPTFNDLGLNPSNITSSQSRYFIVTQVTDVDDFEGCENFTTGTAFIQVQFVDDAALSFEPVISDVDVTNQAEIDANNQFCYDEADIVIDLQADGGSITGGDLANLSYSVDTGVIPDGTGNPTIDLEVWHTGAGGSLVGGLPTTHILTMDFINSNGCTNTVSTSITIHPDPDITFINTAQPNVDPDGLTLCYDDSPITLRGINNERFLTISAPTGTYTIGETVVGQTSGATGEVVSDDGSTLILTNVLGSFDAAGNETLEGQTSFETSTLDATTGANLSLSTGAFTKTGAGLGTTVNNEVVFDPAAAHGADPFAVQSTHVIDFTYTDDNGTGGCQYTISKTIFVDPRPELIPVATGSPEDGDEIHFAAICDDGGSTDVSVIVADASTGLEVASYAGYTFTWTVGTTTFTPVANDNTFSFTVADATLEIDVQIEDPNGCTTTVSETHQKQTLPDLEMTLNGSSGAGDFEFCSDDAAPTLDVLDNNTDLAVPGASIDPADVVSWTITSSNTSGGSGIANGSGSATLPSATDLDIETLHVTAGGNAYASFDGVNRSVGGDTTYHEISITYTDQELSYQGLLTNCTNTVTRTMTIFPTPDITFDINGTNIGSLAIGEDEFCYDDTNVELEAFFTSGDVLTADGEFYIINGTGDDDFTAEGDDILIPTNNNRAFFDPSAQQDARNGGSAGDGTFVASSTYQIRYKYTNEDGCAHFIDHVITVHPRPELIPVATGSPEDGDEIHFAAICDDGGSTDVSVIVADASTGLEVASYAGYTFTWTVGTTTFTPVANDNTFSFTVADATLEIDVQIEDPNGCTTTVSETHQKQTLPDLEMTLNGSSGAGDFEFCSDDAAPTLDVLDNNTDLAVPGASIDPADVVSWTITSSNTSGGSGIANGSGSATLPSATDLDIETLHVTAGGNAYASFDGVNRSVGGDTTYHEISITYTDQELSYQGLLTNCTNTVIRTMTIFPTPDITFDINGTNIGSLAIGEDEFCYDDTNVELEAFFTSGDVLTADGEFYIINGTGDDDFTAEGDDILIPTNNNRAFFDPSAQQDARNGGSAGDGTFVASSTYQIRYKYTNEDGCAHFIDHVITVHPRPELIPVATGSPEDGDEIHFAAICDDGGSTDVSVIVADASTGLEVASYAGYTFTWTVGTTTFTPVANDNTFSFTVADATLEIDVQIEDPNGCTTTVSETHQKQTLPDLEMTLNGSSGAGDFEFCSDDAAPTLDILDNNTDLAVPGASIDPADVVSWTITSSNTSGGSGIANGSGSATLPSATDLDIETLHVTAGGNAYASFDGVNRSVGGDTTYHEISITYTDQELSYQGLLTNCTNTVTRTMTIYPSPDITFEINSSDIGSLVAGEDQFCYDDENVELGAFFSDGDVLTANGEFFIINGTGDDDFTAEGDDILIPTNNNRAFFDPSAQQDARNGGSMGDGAFAVPSDFQIRYKYTNEDGCAHFIDHVITVHPRPEIIPVANGSPEDNDIIFITDFCNDDSNEITVEVKFIEPNDRLREEDDYSNYTFDWTIGVNAVPSNPIAGRPNTNVITVTETDFRVGVTVTDSVGCSRTYSEDHSKQALPNLNFPEINISTNLQEFCSDAGSPIALTLRDFNIPVSVVDVVSWEVLSYDTDMPDTATYVDPAWADVTVEQDADGGSFPEIDLVAWHQGAGGNAYVAGRSIGGNATVHSIYITYIDPNRTYQGVNTNCEATYLETILINPNPDIDFTFFATQDVNASPSNADMQQFCFDETSISIQGTLADGTPLTSGSFTINGANVSTNNGEAIIDAATYGVDPYNTQSTHTVVYTYQDPDTQCTHSVTKQFLVNPRPEFVGSEIGDAIDAIQIANSCASSDIKVFVEMVDNKDNYIFEWQVNGNVEQTRAGTAEGDTLVYALLAGETTANFTVTATYDPASVGASFNTECSAVSVTRSITVGQEPIPALSWVGLTAGHPLGTEFRLYQDNSSLPEGDVEVVELIIDDVLVFNTVGSTASPIDFTNLTYTHFFTASGQYTVELRITTSAGCDVTEVRTVNILPHYTSYNAANSYQEDFESDDAFNLTAPQGGWFVENRSDDGKRDDLTTTWIQGNSIPGIALTENETRAVFTDNYQNEEISFVYSPSLDITGFNAPTISFLRYEDFDSFRDGVVLQYSVDDGRTWTNVGSYDFLLAEQGLASTPGWYNREAITSAPGTQAPAGEGTAGNPEGFGWALNSDWQEAIAPLDVPTGDFVRLRFALASQPGDKETVGFGFDLVEIYDRDQIVLIELFSSTLDDESILFNDTVRTDPAFSGTDLLVINYFTDLSNSGTDIDQINQRNTQDPGAKSSFYGVSGVPSIAISGDAAFVDDRTDLRAEKARLDNAKLEDPAFNITLSASVNADNELLANASFTSTRDFGPTDEIGLFIAVVEPEVTLGEAMGRYDAGATIENVLRKVLPNGAGQYVEGPIAPNDVLRIQDMTWPISNLSESNTFPNSTDLTIIAFAQDLNTKQVYQATSVPLSFTLTEEPLSVGDDLSDFELYPNPADKQFTIEFPEQVAENADWVLYDQAGRAMLRGLLEKGTRIMTVQTDEIPSGLYFIHLYGEDRKRESRRVIVVH